MADRIVDGVTGVSIREQAGQSGSNASNRDTAQRRFLCKDTDDPLIARAGLLNNRVDLGLDIFDGLALKTLSWSPYSDSPSAWDFVADYSYEPEPGGFTIDMDSTGGSITVTEAISQTKHDAPGEMGGDFATSINVDKDGNPKGVSRVIQALKLNVHAKLSDGIASDPLSYAKLVANATGFTNSAPYLTFAAGELLFMGATGQIVGENPLLTYTFLASPNLTNYQVGPITIPSKKGHEYIWATYKSKKDTASKKTVEVIAAAYVAEIYGSTDFSGLGIGA